MIRDVKEIFPHKIYYVESSEDFTVLIAIDLFKQGDFISWFDTRKERIMKIGKILENEKDVFSFVREDGNKETYKFTPMTLEIYNSKVKDKLFNPQEFEDFESLKGAFEETKRNL